MNTNKSISWDQTARVESWNLLLNVGKLMRYPLSPAITAAYNFLHNYFSFGGSLTDFDLVTLCMTSMFVTAKSEIRDESLVNFIQQFGKVASEFTGDRKSLFGSSVDSLKQYIKKNNPMHLEKVRSNILQCEFAMLNTNKWEFITDHAFSPLIYWLSEIKKAIKSDKTNTEGRAKFDTMRAECVHNICTLFIAMDGPWPPGTHIAASALLYTLSLPNYRHGFLPDDFMEYIMEEVQPNIKDNITYDFPALAARINDAILP